MFIIWGSKVREFEQGSGQFHCPKCEREQDYKHVRLARYFTLYFLPLFETEDLGQFVKCDGCTTTYKEQVLDYKPPSKFESLVIAIRTDLAAGTSVELIERKLLDAGLSTDVVNQMMTLGLGEGKRVCSECNLTFAASASRCSGCNARL